MRGHSGRLKTIRDELVDGHSPRPTVGWLKPPEMLLVEFSSIAEHEE
jgi:hypothetical protein